MQLTINQRIEQFISALEPLQDKEQIKTLCESEVEYLRRERAGIEDVVDKNGIVQSVTGNVNALHKYLTQYRSAVKKLSLTSGNSHQVKIGKPGNYQIINEHYAYHLLVKRDVEKDTRAQSLNERRKEKLDSRIQIEPDKIINKALELLNTESYLNITIALCILSGRRMSEVLKTAQLTALDSNSVMFRGQLKKKSLSDSDIEDTAYEIPVLANSKQIESALNHLRELRDFSDLSPDEIRGKCTKSLKEVALRHFSFVKSDIKVHDLRGIYMTICLHRYKPNATDENTYIASIGGHEQYDLDTANTYKQFYIE
jgi:phosphoglycolate phosphatase-like HAD superfamily hydrolase